MKKTITFLIAFVTLAFSSGVFAQVMPALSSADNSNEHWYYLKCYRENGKVVLDNASHQGGTWDVNNLSSFRKFKVVKDAENDTYGIVYKSDETYLYLQKGGSDDASTVSFTETAFTGFTFTEALTTASAQTGQAIAGLPALRISRSATGFLHMKVTGGNFGLRFYNEIEDANLFVFFTGKTQLLENITLATNRLTNTVEGEGPGEFPTAARTTLSGAISAAQNVYNNEASTEADMFTATATLQADITEYNNSQKAALPFKVSDETTNVWYQVRDKRAPAVYWNVATVGTTINALNRTTTSNPTANTQLFKFVKAPSPAEGYYIYSKTDETTALSALEPDNGSVVSIDAAQDPMTWIFSKATEGYFLIQTETNNRQLNSFNDKISFYDGGAADAGNNWQFVELDATVLRAAFLNTCTNARTLHTASSEGAEFGQYSSVAKTTFDGVIATEEAKTAEEMNSDQLEAGILALNNAITAYKATMNKDLNTLLSTNSENYKWYWIRSNATGKAYCEGKVISQGVRAVGDKYTYEDKADPMTDAQLFRFVLNAENNKVVSIINKLGTHMAANGAIAAASTEGNEFSLSLLTDGVSFSIKPTTLNTLHAQETGAHIVNWPGDAGSASAWVFDFAEETEKGAARTVTVTSNLLQGSAVITGTELTSISSSDAISVTATALENYYFVNWTNTDGGAVVSTANPYSYTGTEDISLTANFATNGVAVAPMVWTEENKTYYYIYSAADGSKALGDAPHNLRPYCLLSPSSADGVKLTWGLPTEGDDNDLWVLTEVEEVLKLRNVATGKYLTGSDTQNATGAEVFVTAYAEPYATQYKIGNTGTNPIIAWNSNTADKYSDQGVNSKTAWYFVAGTPTGPISGLELNNDSKFSVYAVNGQIHISSPSAETLDIAVYSIAGQNLYRTRSNSQSIVLNKSFSAGAYMVKINDTVTKVMLR